MKGGLFLVENYKIFNVSIDGDIVTFDIDLNFFDHIDCFPVVIKREYRARCCEFNINDKFNHNENGFHFQLARIHARYGLNCVRHIIKNYNMRDSLEAKAFKKRLCSAGSKLRRNEREAIYDSVFKRK